MSGILGIFSAGPLPDPAVVERMRAQLGHHGSDRSSVWRGEGAVLAASRDEWELGPGFSGPVLVLEADDCVIAADATLYHRADLRRRLRAAGVEAPGDSPSHLILAAYRAWGEECTRWLEGDFAFILWDRRERRVLCSRDFSGRRLLYFAELGDTLVVASTMGSILSHPSCPEDLNLPVLAATAGMLITAVGVETCYRAIRVMPIASDLRWRAGGGVRLSPHWTPTAAAGVSELPFERAAEELRALLCTATGERLAPEGPTTVWLSGGWDSTAVFGVGQDILRTAPSGRSLLPVSMTYPEGDPGNEDETIEQVAGFWRTPVHWVQSEGIPLLDRPASDAAARDEPLPHMYEFWNRELARGSRALGSRVALDGYGGDNLFQLSLVYLADLFRRGRWLELSREWRARRSAGRRQLLRFTVQPLVPRPLWDLWHRLFGSEMTMHSHMERPIPPWISPDFVRRHDLVGRQRALLPRLGPGGYTEAEIRWYLAAPMMAHLSSHLAQLARQEGVELRSPLFDRRVVEFALARPRRERVAGHETKYLLRRAVRGLLPDEVLAPRPYRTGMTIGYSSRRMEESYPAAFEELFHSPLLLAELGIVDEGELRHAVREYLAGRVKSFNRVNLFYTLQTEWWLRSRLRPSSRVEGPFVPAGTAAGGW